MKQITKYISDHLLVFCTLAFIAGIALASRLRFSEPLFPALGIGLFFFLAALVVLQLVYRHRLLMVMLPFFCVGLGCFHTLIHLQVPGGKLHIYNRVAERSDLLLIGTMAAMEKFDGRTSQAVIALERLRYSGKSTLDVVHGNVLLRLQGAWPKEYLPGDTLAVRAELRRPASYKTPGGFDYARHLARENIWVTGFVRSPRLLQKVDSSPSLICKLRYLPERIRTTLGRHIDMTVGRETSAIYRAILLGDRSRVDDATLEAFKGSGTMHILAISGLHMAVIGFLTYTSFSYLLGRSEKLLLRVIIKKWAAFLCLPLLIGYALIAGMNTPVCRAVIMSGIVIAAICTDRKKSPGPLLAFAALLILAFDPLQLFSASFQLSFAAVAAILFLLPTLQHLFLGNSETTNRNTLCPKILTWLYAAFLVSLAATLATAPISVIVFNRFSTIGPFANLVIEPLICLWALPAGLLAIPFLTTLPEISVLLFKAGSLGVAAASHATAFFSSLPFSTIWLPPPPVPLVLGYYLLLSVFVMHRQYGQNRALVRLSLLSFCIVFFSLALNNEHLHKQSDGFRVSYLDVGQGSASLVEFSSGYTVLVDGGGSSLGSVSVGERVIAPFLWNRGIRKLDAIAITHPDADHYNGLPFIIRHFSPKLLWVRDKVGHDHSFRQLIRLAEDANIQVVIPKEEQRIGTEKEYFTCVANTQKWHHPSGEYRRRNAANSGLVLKACSHEHCVLFPGDIEKEEEHFLVTEGFNLKADIVLAPHHGSETSSSTDFLSRVAPAFMVVSAGLSSNGRFPHSHVQEECRKQHISLLTTARHGTLEMVVNQGICRLYGYYRPADNPLYPMQPVLLKQGRVETSDGLHATGCKKEVLHLSEI